jgi:NAD(P)-dependent dehydrogenase (short-subunit alcohol dehydrogenase family)
MNAATSPVALPHDTGFSGRVALVTGGAGGIGQAVAVALAERGATVIAADIGSSADATTTPLARSATTVVHLDVTRKSEVEALIARIVASLGRLDLVVNVAGVVSHGSAASVAESEWDRVMDINLKGTFLVSQAAMAPMKAQRFGRIVNLGSVVGKNGGNPRPWISPDEQTNAGNVAYGVSKAGVHAMTTFLAKELAAFNITVNAVAPGPIATTMTTQFPAHLTALVPVGRMGTMDEVVAAILFLLSPTSAYITGEVLDINGGLWCD